MQFLREPYCSWSMLGLDDQMHSMSRKLSLTWTLRRILLLSSKAGRQFTRVSMQLHSSTECCRWLQSQMECVLTSGLRIGSDETGAPTVRPLDSSEAGEWLRAVLVKAGHTVEGRKLTSHSLKATCLSFAAKRGFSQPDRLTLGYHDMAHRYARDAMSRPLQLLSDMMREIREGVFFPDNKRSGRLMPKGATKVVKGSSLSPTPKQAPAPFSLVEGTARWIHCQQLSRKFLRMSWNRLQAQTMVLVRNMLWALFPWLRRQLQRCSQDSSSIRTQPCWWT